MLSIFDWHADFPKMLLQELQQQAKGAKPWTVPANSREDVPETNE